MNKIKDLFPIAYCSCCRNCKYRNNLKSLFDVEGFATCADINGVELTAIVPNIFYIVDWCKLHVNK